MATEILATSLPELALRLGQIFYFIVLPVLLLAGLGFLLQRKLGLEMATLTRLNFYFVVPAVVYVSIVRSQIDFGQAARAGLFGLGMLAAMAGAARLAAWIRRVPPDQRNVLSMTAMFHNSGNYGLPLQELAFRGVGLGAEALTLQVVMLVVQNISGFTLGVVLAASGRADRHWKENLFHVLKFPPLYTLPAALLTVGARSWLGEAAPGVALGLLPFWEALTRVGDAMVAVALLTLGAQLATMGGQRARYPVKTAVFLRLIVGPALGLALIYVLRAAGLALTPFEAQVLLISTCTPTAVNCMLLCLQFDNHPELAARAVFYSTLLSPVTVTLTILIAQAELLPGFALP